MSHPTPNEYQNSSFRPIYSPNSGHTGNYIYPTTTPDRSPNHLPTMNGQPYPMYQPFSPWPPVPLTLTTNMDPRMYSGPIYTTSPRHAPRRSFDGGYRVDYPPSLPVRSPPSAAPYPSSPTGTNRGIDPRHRYRCDECGKTFDRKIRLDACINGHAKSKPYACGGECGYAGCNKRYGSKDHLKRHHKQCKPCGRDVSRQNHARQRSYYV